MTLSIGTRLGPYEVLSTLGAGGMGEVYRARDSRLGRDVAIKVLPSELSADVERLKRFEKEARSASSLNHPSIVTVYEIGQADSVSYIAMELVDGKTLRDLIAGGPLTIKKLLQIGAQVADGLARAHEAGIVHRDLKPENVMVTKDGLAKILDFGLAKLTRAEGEAGDVTNLPTQTATTPGVVMGTVGYMSPEQASGHPLDFRSDQFSFGAILYEMATGTRAFQKKTAVQTLAAILQEEPEPVGARNPQAPVPLRWIIERCLAKEPEDRYVSTRDLARELATVRDRLSEATLSGAALVAAPSRASSRVRAAVAALAVLVAVSMGVFAGRPVWKARFASRPVVRQLTYRRAGIQNARFAPDGTIVYGAVSAQPDNLSHIFSTRPGTPEPRSLGLPPGDVLSISASGNLAIRVGMEDDRDTLATVPLAGGAPREVLEHVREADWAPDGMSLAAIRIVERNMERRFQLEFPLGKVLYEPPGWIRHLQFSPRGDLLVFADHKSFASAASQEGDLTVMDRTGKRRVLARVPWELRWSPRGDEIWFTEIQEGATSIAAVTLSGRKRLLASFPGIFGLQDVSRDGRVLLERVSEQIEAVGRFPGQSGERNLSWLDRSIPAGLSDDGKTLLFTETGQGGGASHAVYKRNTDGSDAVRLGDGAALALSPDGMWALSSPGERATHLVLLPTGAGQPREIPLPGIQLFGRGASFFPDGNHIVVRGAEPGHGKRLYVLDVRNGKSRPITAEGALDVEASVSVSPDGKLVLSSASDGKNFLYNLEGGPPRAVTAIPKGYRAIQWCADGRSLFVATGDNPIKVSRLELSSGRLDPWKEFSVSDIGAGWMEVIPAPDGKSYVYSYRRYFSDLFLAEGLK